MSLNTAATTIPRFLLPQLTWKRSSPRSFAVVASTQSQATPPPVYHPTPRKLIPSLLIQQPRHVIPIFKSLSLSPLHCIRQPFPSQSSSTLHRPFSTTRRLPRDHHFDTLKFVQRLQDEGFSEDQARAMMLVLSDVIEESIQNLTRTMVLREGYLPPFPPPTAVPLS